MTSITSAILLLRILAVSQVLLLAAALASSPNPHRTRLVGVALAIGAVSYLMSAPALDAVNLGAGRWFALPADAIPPLLFMFSWYLFEDDRNLPLVFWMIAAAYLVAASWIGLSDFRSAGPNRVPTMMALQIVKLGFAIGSISVAWMGREVDVVENRLRFRRTFAAGIGVIVMAVVATELIAAWQVPDAIELVGIAAIFIATLSINLAFLRLNPTFALSSQRPTPSPRAEFDPLVDQLKHLMGENKAYTNPDLRIADLASSAKVPEYVLRRTINSKLGYRNFNQFVNGYRVEDAAERLIKEPRTPVLTIALDVGFRSISSFNSAFQARYKTVPTQYRKDGLTDS
jgi:AraC-like DNA-binding protein